MPQSEEGEGEGASEQTCKALAKHIDSPLFEFAGYTHPPGSTLRPPVPQTVTGWMVSIPAIPFSLFVVSSAFWSSEPSSLPAAVVCCCRVPVSFKAPCGSSAAALGFVPSSAARYAYTCIPAARSSTCLSLTTVNKNSLSCRLTKVHGMRQNGPSVAFRVRVRATSEYLVNTTSPPTLDLGSGCELHDCLPL